MPELKYTYTERMAYECGLQTAKTAIQCLEWMDQPTKDALMAAMEKRAQDKYPEMRVLEPARKNLKNLN